MTPDERHLLLCLAHAMLTIIGKSVAQLKLVHAIARVEQNDRTPRTLESR